MARSCSGCLRIFDFSHALEVCEELPSTLTLSKGFSDQGPNDNTPAHKKSRRINGAIDDRETREWDVKESQNLPERYVKEMQHLPQPRLLAKPTAFAQYGNNKFRIKTPITGLRRAPLDF
jgi:hypothetical protein